MSKERRVPTQLRSQEKYDKVLLSAKVLIGGKGNDAVSMREIAKHSGVALASIYQYFPDKNTILKAIMEDYFDKIREMIVSLIESCETVEELSDSIILGVDLFYKLFINDPALATLWGGLQASAELKDLDAKDSQINAKIITKKFCTLSKDKNEPIIYDAIFLMLFMAGATVRLALSMPEPQGKRLMDELKVTVLLRFNSLI